MFEVLSKSPSNPWPEVVISERVGEFGGWLTYREEPELAGMEPVCLTYAFNEFEEAEAAASQLRSQDEHVEGPMGYGE